MYVHRTLTTPVLCGLNGCFVWQDTFLAKMYAGMRSLRLADGACVGLVVKCAYQALDAALLAGPDEVHLRSIALLELKELAKSEGVRARL